MEIQLRTYLNSLLVLLMMSCGVELPTDIMTAYDNLPAELDFNIHVKPILSDKCFACHGPDKGKIEAGLQLHTAETAYAELPESPNNYAIAPGNLSDSEMFKRIIAEDPNEIMPPPAFKITLSNHEKAVLIKWIEDGAHYQPHWAFVKPQKEEAPEVVQKSWLKNEIDRFVLARLEKEKLTPSPKASKELLLRRLSLDLTGLPPSLDEIRTFVEDKASNAYEKQVDRLLESPHYGEKLAVDWMDVSRYADTHGYQVDRYRDMSPWRDWVIEAFNGNQPYNEFLTWQIAGDLLPNATKDQILATGYNRLHQQNMEGGIVDEEYRVEYVADRTSVLSQGVMGLTYGCARCHDHKYDPISQKNFYELYSFFNNINESGQISWDPMDIPVPNLLLPTQQQEELLTFLQEQEARQQEKVKRLEGQVPDDFEAWLISGRYKADIKHEVVLGQNALFQLNGNLRNQVNGVSGVMDRKFSEGEKPIFQEGKSGQGLKLDGDAWLDLAPIGVFQRSEPFSIGLWVKFPKDLKEGVIFHKNQAVRLHSYKGYHLYLKDGKLELMMAHTWPDNAIVAMTREEVPREKWVHLMMTYDGSSKAKGLKLFVDGDEQATEVITDNLYKDIIFHDYEDIIYEKPIEPGLKIGGRWRGIGIKGAIVDEITVFGRALTQLEILNLSDRDTLGSKEMDMLSEGELAMFKSFYMAHHSQTHIEANKQLKKIRTALVDSAEDIQEVMVMKEMSEPRQAYVLERGVYDSYGEKVYPNTPEDILPYPEEYPKNRLGLAKWLTHPDHPLTARVAVNRYWQNLFGRGLVKTSEDFGNQGELPSHPKLLDWLAIRFMESGWDVKALHKLMVMSATYRQSSLIADSLRGLDPENVLLARGPQFRLTSEMMRDNALYASGLLSDEIGGESVRPYQPEGIWAMNAATYEQGAGKDLYKRSLYTIWKRTVPHPTQATFDQPERVECTVRRQKTNTPLQALVLLNDPTFIEASKKIGEAISRESDLVQGISNAYCRLTGRKIMPQELEILTQLQREEYENFKVKKDRAKGWLESGNYRIDESLDSNLVAANAVVASVILNSDATITKR